MFIIALKAEAQLKEFTSSEIPQPDVSVVQANVKFPEDAMVLIYTSVEGLEFRSSMGAIDKVNYNSTASRYELLLKPIKQMVFVSKLGFIEHKITTLNPNPKDVLYYKVEEKKNEIIESIPGKLLIQTQPSVADITINGFKVSDKSPSEFELNAGSTKIKLKKKKFEDFDTTVIVYSNQLSVIDVKLNPSFLFINVNSNPTGAIVSLEGEVLGRTPLNREFDLSDKDIRGVKTLNLKYEGYTEINDKIDYLPAVQPLELKYELKKVEGTFIIKSQPSGASVFIDGQYKGITPLEGKMELGIHDVEVKQDEFRPCPKQKMNLSNDAKNELLFTLIPVYYENEDSESQIQNLESVKIGNNTWLQKNLNVNQFQNGELIPEAITNEEWKNAGANQVPAWCYKDNNPQNGLKYGKLYNWYAISDSRGICPIGWHVPNEFEWKELLSVIELENSMDQNGFAKIKKELGQLEVFSETKNSINFLNSGLRLPEGYEIAKDNGGWGFWWSSTMLDNEYAWYAQINILDSTFLWANNWKSKGYSVRCVKDDISLTNNSNIKSGLSEPVKCSDVYTVLDKMPEYNGGDLALREYISKNLIYPKPALESKISGTVYLTFVIDYNGGITDVKTLRGNDLLNEEAIRIIKAMPKWNPGSSNGVPACVQFTLPIKFTLPQ